MPSGPNVTITSGSTVAMNAAMARCRRAFATAVLVSQDVHLVDIESGEAVAKLGVAERPEPAWRPRLRVARAALAERGGDDDNADRRADGTRP